MPDYTDEDRRAWLEENYSLMPTNGDMCDQTKEVIDRMMREEDQNE